MLRRGGNPDGALRRTLASLMPWSFSSVAAFSHSGASDLQWPAREAAAFSARRCAGRQSAWQHRWRRAPPSAARRSRAHIGARTAPRRVELHRLVCRAARQQASRGRRDPCAAVRRAGALRRVAAAWGAHDDLLLVHHGVEVLGRERDDVAGVVGGGGRGGRHQQHSQRGEGEGAAQRSGARHGGRKATGAGRGSGGCTG